MSEATLVSAAQAPAAQQPAAATRPLPWAATVVAAVLVLLPWVAGGYWTFTLGLCFANAIALLSVSFMVPTGAGGPTAPAVFVAAGA